MAERDLIERLDDAIEAILAGRREGLAIAEPELATLLMAAQAALRGGRCSSNNGPWGNCSRGNRRRLPARSFRSTETATTASQPVRPLRTT